MHTQQKMVAFSLRLDLARGKSSFSRKWTWWPVTFSVGLNWVINFSNYVKKIYGPIFSVEQVIIVGNMNLANNCDYGYGAITWIYWV